MIQKKKFSLLFFFVFLFFFTSATSAASTQLTDSQFTATESGITKSESIGCDISGSVDNHTSEVSVDNPTGSVAAIYGDKIVWMDNRNGKNDIYMYDHSAHKETQITNQGSATNPAFYGDRIVWQDSRNGNSDIYIYNISTRKETQITANGSAYYPDIYGDRVVWENHKNLDIYMYNLSTSIETQITTSGNAHNPAIYDNFVVWLDGRCGKSDIYMHDLSTRKETQISTSGNASIWNNGFDSGGLVIYGYRVIWQEGDYNGNFDIHIYNISTQKESKITTSGSASHPAIYGDRIVWIDSRGLSNLYMYNLSTSTETPLIFGVSTDSPAIYVDRLVWMNYRNGIPHLYMYNLSSELPFGTSSEDDFIYYFPDKLPPVATFSISPIFGKAPLNVTFTDKTIGTPAVWNWNFGDGNNSTQQNPTHIYSKPGTYTINLTVSNGNGTDSKASEIDVKNALSTGPYAYITNSGTTMSL